MINKTLYFQSNAKYLRKLKDKSQQAVSNQLEIPNKRFQSYEEGRAMPNILMIDKIAQYYNETLNDMCFTDLTKIRWKINE